MNGGSQPPARRADVAERAGVSPAVVSYVLNGGPRKVSPDTRDRVLKAVRDLDYRPNHVARSLRTQRTMTIGLIVPDLANPFFTELMHSIQREAFESSLALMVGDSGEDGALQEQYIRSFVERRVDGLILLPAHAGMSGLEHLKERGLPWVAIDRYVPGGAEVATVMVGNWEGGFQATNHLLEHGRRRIGCIAGPANVRSTVERVSGWRSAMTSRGIEPENHLLRHAVFQRAAGYRETTRMIESAEVDAIFCASDEQALGVMRALNDLGLRCPEDVALVSFDGIPTGADVTPSLTTMAQPFAEIGRAAVERLIERIADPGRMSAATLLPVHLVRRESCGCAATDRDDYTVSLYRAITRRDHPS
ncbi:LacI family DNA-binding transcriptional regulator [Ruania alba]|uniref:Transcriptional regulator, LacI family n=1 Tax=Ruania alba TaxID=648782 RepID=A0A1H5CPT4_9MICO|nr:LacI family DNA-binding transcriptional regulator [Ruania alba]SED68625.1 transcriptional regulator, LacI family [Ruania alba]